MCNLFVIPPHLSSPPAADTQSVALLLLLLLLPLGFYLSSDFIFCQDQNMQEPKVLLVLKKCFTLKVIYFDKKNQRHAV